MRVIFLVVVLIYLTACGGGGDESSPAPAQQVQPLDSSSNDSSDNTSTESDTSNDDDDSSSDDDSADISLSNLIIPAEFDWATSDTKQVSLNVVSSITQIETVNAYSQAKIEGAPIGGKHFVKVEALDSNDNVVSTPLKSLTSRAGKVSTVMKLPPTVTEIRVSAKANGKDCTKRVAVIDLKTSLNIECDIPVSSDEENSK